ncbi:MAG: alpha/beta hydrolase [Burkholderiaceae bacterium]
MARAIIGLAVLLAMLYLGVCALLFFLQDSMIYYPQPRSLPAGQLAATIHTPDADLVVTVHESESRNALIYFGGNAEDVSLSLPELREAFPDHALYLLHYRGYGGSSGKPSEANLHRDAAALYRKVSDKHARITIVGRSLGSGVAIRLAAAHPAQRLILITPYYSLEELAARQFPYIPVRWILQHKFESWRHAPRVGVPTSLIVAERDEVVPAESARALYAAFRPGIAEYSVIHGAHHNDISSRSDYVRALRGSISEDQRHSS